MINNRFEAYKLRREIKRSGVTYEFYRISKNEWNERPNYEESTFAGSIKGIYHEVNSQITTTTSDGSVTRTKKQPALLCLASDFKSVSIQFGDIVDVANLASINGMKRMKYVGAVDIANWGIIIDLSFEEVDDGGQGD